MSAATRSRRLEEVRRVPWNGYVVASLFAGGGGVLHRLPHGRLPGRLRERRRRGGPRHLPRQLRRLHDRRRHRRARGPRRRDPRRRRGRHRAPRARRPRRLAALPGVLDRRPARPHLGPRGRGTRTAPRSAPTTSSTSTPGSLDELRPKAFVAENVAGLVRGVARGYFKRILAALKEPGYRVEARLLDAQWLGVPQTRQRLIFVGVRDDLGARRRPSPAARPPLPAGRRLPGRASGSRRAATALRTCSTTRPRCRRAPSPPPATPRSASYELVCRTARGASSRSTSSRRSARSRPTTSSPAPTARPGPGSATACRR